MPSTQNEGYIQPRIVRGQVDSVSLFEITDYELQLLEQGSPNNIYLSFAIFFLSIAASFLTTLLTISVPSVKVFLLFVVVTAVGFSVGGVLLFLWYQSRTHVRGLMHKIKARVPLTTTNPVVPAQTTPIGATESPSKENS